MPTISEFYGIKIYIYWNDLRQHHRPHFHAKYNGSNAVFALNGQLLSGNMPVRAKKLICTWALENHDDLLYAWNCAVKLKSLPKIRGLA